MDRLQEILESKLYKNKMRPLSDYQTEQIQKLSSRYILFTKKQGNKIGFCENCVKDVVFENGTKHKELVECPSCKKKMRIEHTWRKKGCDDNLDWFVKGQAVGNDVFVLRYYSARQFRSYRKTIEEDAREIFDFKTAKRFRLCHHYGKQEWQRDNYHFVEFNMYNRRRDFCGYAKEIECSQLLKELEKIDALKYYDWESKISYYYLMTALYGLLKAPLYEKMEKVGLGSMVVSDFTQDSIRWNSKEKSLIKMLKLDKIKYKWFMKCPNTYNLSFLQRYKNISEKEIEFVLGNTAFRAEPYIKLRCLKIKKIIKVMKYVESHKDIYWFDYIDYLGTLKELGYDLNDEYYLMPKNFRKEDKRVADEKAKRDKLRAQQALTERDNKITAISNGIKNMPGIQEFLNGSKGLLVYVPETAEQLEEESKKLHNCLSKYPDRIAKNQTLVFFVRRLEAPNDPFVALEYTNGEVIQCRFDHNEAVKDDEKGAKILDFVDAFAEKLRENKVLCAA